MPCTLSRSLRRSCSRTPTASVKVDGKTWRRRDRTASTTADPDRCSGCPHNTAYLAGGRQRILGEAQRVDFTAMPVYTVDDADTVETDDGISIEPLQPDGTYQAGAFAKWAGLFGRTRARAGLGLG